MSLQLPEPDRAQLARSPLELVVCQIRFDRRLAASDGATARAFHDALGGAGGRYPRIEEAESASVSLTLGPGGEPAVGDRSRLTGWRFISPGGDWVVALMPDHVSLETSAYTTWEEDFEPRLAEVVNAAQAAVSPTIEQRAGLRYIDRITELGLSELAAWRKHIRPEILGIALHPELGPAVKAAQQQVVLEIGDQLACVFRHAPLFDAERDAVDYLLDFDVYREGGRPFERDAIMETVSTLHTVNLQLFQATVTPELRERLSAE